MKLLRVAAAIDRPREVLDLLGARPTIAYAFMRFEPLNVMLAEAHEGGMVIPNAEDCENLWWYGELEPGMGRLPVTLEDCQSSSALRCATESLRHHAGDSKPGERKTLELARSPSFEQRGWSWKVGNLALRVGPGVTPSQLLTALSTASGGYGCLAIAVNRD